MPEVVLQVVTGAAGVLDKSATSAAAPRDMALGHPDGVSLFTAHAAEMLCRSQRMVGIEADIRKAYDSVQQARANELAEQVGACAIPALARQTDARRDIVVAGERVAPPEGVGVVTGRNDSNKRLALMTRKLVDAVLGVPTADAALMADNVFAAAELDRVPDMLCALTSALDKLGFEFKHVRVILAPDSAVEAEVRAALPGWKVGATRAEWTNYDDALIMGTGFRAGGSRRIRAMEESLSFAHDALEYYPAYLLAQYALPKLSYDARCGVAHEAVAPVQRLVEEIAKRIVPDIAGDALHAPVSRGGLGLPDIHAARDLLVACLLLVALLSAHKFLADAAWRLAAPGAAVPEGIWAEGFAAARRLGVQLEPGNRVVRVAGEVITTAPKAQDLLRALERARPAYAPQPRPARARAASLLTHLLQLDYRPKPRLTNPACRALMRLHLRASVNCPACRVRAPLHHHVCKSLPGYEAFPPLELHQCEARATRDFSVRSGIPFSIGRDACEAASAAAGSPHIFDGHTYHVRLETGDLAMEIKTARDAAASSRRARAQCGSIGPAKRAE